MGGGGGVTLKGSILYLVIYKTYLHKGMTNLASSANCFYSIIYQCFHTYKRAWLA